MKTLIEIIEYVGLKEQQNTILDILKNCDNNWLNNFIERVISGEDGYLLAEEIIPVAKKLNLHQYTLGLYLLLAVAEKSQILYKEKGVPQEYFLSALDDIKVKMAEAMAWNNVFGISSFGWQSRFFCLKTIAMGRLQFEQDYRAEFEYNGYVKINKGDHILNLHIPSGSKLDLDQCVTSLKKAFNFFKHVRIGKYMPVILTNWFLYPPFKKLFSPNGNLVKFVNLFDVVESINYPNFRIAHRIFDTDDISNPDKLPQKTTLQQNFVKYIKEGKPCGYGVGFLLFDGERIITKKDI